jgi:hypothetical protein
MGMHIDGGTPRVLALDLNNSRQLVISPTQAYWNDLAGNTIHTARLSGGTATTFFEDSDFYAQGLAVDAHNLYYTEDSALGPVGAIPTETDRCSTARCCESRSTAAAWSRSLPETLRTRSPSTRRVSTGRVASVAW